MSVVHVSDPSTGSLVSSEVITPTVVVIPTSPIRDHNFISTQRILRLINIKP